MIKIFFETGYEQVLSKINNEHFYIFGNTTFAHIFYLYCQETGIEKNIEAFVLSSMDRNQKKVCKEHGIPLRDIDWLKKKNAFCHILLAAKEKTVKEQLIPLLDANIEGCVYYISDLAQHILYSRFMYRCYGDMLRRYRISASLFKREYVNISEHNSTHFYKYVPRIANGVMPDSSIFHAEVGLDELYQKQLGDYIFVSEPETKDESRCKCKIYMAKSHFDKELKENFHTPYIETIQVGAALTDIDISELKDNTGENISDRNQDYCEMSAAYWAWKNDADSDYIGLCHYRRRFVMDNDVANYIMSEGYDAVYAVPELTDGGMREEFVERNYFLTPEMWELTQDAIYKISPQYMESWMEFGRSYFLIPCNLLIMRRDVFEDYCQWVFSVLEEADSYYLQKGIQCNNRYLGYIAECLNTVYVMKNKAVLKKCYLEYKLLE